MDAQLSTLESNQARLRTETLSPGRVITQARLPRSPSSPDPLVTLAAGVLVGAAVGLGLAALRHRRDDLIRTPDDLVRRTHVPVAAVLSKPLHSGEVSLLGPLAAALWHGGPLDDIELLGDTALFDRFRAAFPAPVPV